MLKITEYSAPTWAKDLRDAPANIVQLAMKPTPIHEWRLPGVPDGFEVLIKRDDLTGAALTGNKVRKLEFLLADAMSKGCKHVISSGSTQSNHARSLAVACAQLGLQCHIFLAVSSDNPKADIDMNCEGNMFLSKLCGAKMYCINMDLFKSDTNVSDEAFRPRKEELAEQIRQEKGEESYMIPNGGASMLGKWGYFDAFEEILNQGVEFDDLVCCCGSGGMQASLAIANYLNGSPYRIHGILSCYSSKFYLDFITKTLNHFGLDDKVKSGDLITLHDEYFSPGYDQNTPEQLEFCARTAEETGVIVDNCYNGKAALGLIDLMQNKPHVFKGRRIMYINSGGMFSLQTAEVMDAVLPFATKGNITLVS